MATSDDLQSNHPLLRDGFNDGFRAPDLGWVGSTLTLNALEAWPFEAGSSIFSNFWVGPIGPAQLFATALVQDFQAWLRVMAPDEDSDEGPPVVSVAVWTHEDTGLALVATQSLTSDFRIDDIPSGFWAFGAYGDALIQVLFDGIENSPHAALAVDVLENLGDISRDDYVALVLSAVAQDEAELEMKTDY